MKVGTNGTIIPPVESIVGGAQRAERLGYDSIWWPDHLMGWHPESVWTPDVTDLVHGMRNPHEYVDPIASIAACAVSTETIHLGTSVTEPVRRHPAMIAQQWLTLDHLSKGRVILGIGSGETENIEPYGIEWSKPVSRFEEALKIIRLLWEHDEPVDFDGEFWTLRDAVVGLAPYRVDEDGTRHYPPIWSGAHGPRMLGIVGTLCDGWLPTYGGGPEAWGEKYATIRAAATEAGRDPDAIEPGLWAQVVIAESEDEVERILSHPIMKLWALTGPAQLFTELGHEHPVRDDWYGLMDYVPARWSKEDALAAAEKVPTEVLRHAMLCGTPDTITEELRAFEAKGLQHVVLWNITYMGDVSTISSSYKMLGAVAEAVRT